MKLSVLLPVYCVEAYVGKTFESVFVATTSVDDFKVIVVNDCAKVESMGIVRRYANRRIPQSLSRRT